MSTAVPNTTAAPSLRRKRRRHYLVNARFQLKYSNGPLTHEAMMRSIELYGREVIPRVRALVTQSKSPPTLQSA